MTGSWCWLSAGSSAVAVRGPGSPPYSLSMWLVCTVWQLSSKRKEIEASSLKAWAEGSQNIFLLRSVHQSSPRFFLDLKEGKITSTAQWKKGPGRGESNGIIFGVYLSGQGDGIIYQLFSGVLWKEKTPITHSGLCSSHCGYNGE